MNSVKTGNIIFNIKIFLFFVTIISAVNIFPQSSLNPDSLKTGVSYKFVLYNETEVIGKVASQDSLVIIVYGDKGSYRLKKDEIFFISRNLQGSRFTVMLSLGGGTAFLNMFEHDYYGGHEFKPKFSLQASSLFMLSENKGIRTDIGFSRWKRDAFFDQGYMGSSSTNFTSERSYDFYYFKGNFVFGSLSPLNKFWIYGTAGFGIHMEKHSSYYHTYSYYSSYDSTYYSGKNDYDAVTNTNLMISAGGSFGYRFNKNWGIYADTELIYAVNEGFLLLFWGNGKTYLPIRAGITYTFY